MSDDVMQRLAAAQPLPRGERLARSHDPFWWAQAKPPTVDPRERPDPLWYALLERGSVVGPLDNAFVMQAAVESAALWREYAAPLRRCREERQMWRRKATSGTEEGGQGHVRRV